MISILIEEIYCILLMLSSEIKGELSWYKIATICPVSAKL